MLCISVSYKKTPAQLRQKFSFSEDEQKDFLNRLLRNGIVSGGVILSTCNRSELYVTVSGRNPMVHEETEAGRSLGRLEELFAEYKGLSHSQIRKNCLFYQGKRAVFHLYKVVCGLDSMVLGEDEILHQTKAAYQLSQELGCTDGELNIIFQGAFNCAKLSKSETRISETPVSIGTLTANCVAEFIKEMTKQEENTSMSAGGGSGQLENTSMPEGEEKGQREIVQTREDRNKKPCVMVIGAGGQIGSIVAKDLIAKGISVIGTSRSHPAREGLWQDEDMTWIHFGRRYEYIHEVAAVVSATKSPHYTLTRDEFARARDCGESMLLVDLAVPYDIDRDIEDEAGVKVLGIDHFKELSERNSALKLNEAEKMSDIASECAEDALKRIYIRNFFAIMPRQEEWFSKMIFYLKDSLDSDTLLRVLKRISQQEMGG